jgi:predicted Zn-dependent peptidase
MGEPASVLSYGDKEHTTNATAKECYEQFQKLLSTCNIEIFYVGNVEKPFIIEKFKEAFSNIDRNVEEFPTTKPSIAKDTLAEVTEEIDVNQAKMVMAFKTTHQDKHHNAIMNTILGMSPFSKLFTNVREKLSLCYYCQSSLDNLKKTIFIDSGIELENFEKSKEAILQQVKDLQEGNFTTQDIDNAIKYLCNSLKSIGDTPSSYVSWYFNNILIGYDRTIESEYAKYLAVTKEDIIESAKALTLDTIYFLKPM